MTIENFGQLQDLMKGSDIATREDFERIFETFLNRAAPEDVSEHFLSKNYKIAGVEGYLKTTPEFRASGRVMQSKFRDFYDGSRLVIAPAKVICCPIYKVANTSIKEWVLKLHGAAAEADNSVHGSIDEVDIPLTLKKWTFTDLDRLRRDQNWKKVAVIRDPLERLVSCYWDKFVVNRRHPLNLVHTLPTYRFFNEGKDPSIEQIAKGLSFQQLCQYINLSAREDMDPHLAAQYVFVQNAHLDHLFDIKSISKFEDFVRGRLPETLQDIRLGLRNAATRKRTVNLPKGSLAKTLPKSFADAKKPPVSAFVTADIGAFVKDYYWLDYRLLESVE